jgi:hypothetical protein
MRDVMAREKKSIVITKDDTILRKRLRSLIHTYPNFDVIAEAGDSHNLPIRFRSISKLFRQT